MKQALIPKIREVMTLQSWVCFDENYHGNEKETFGIAGFHDCCCDVRGLQANFFQWMRAWSIGVEVERIELHGLSKIIESRKYDYKQESSIFKKSFKDISTCVTNSCLRITNNLFNFGSKIFFYKIFPFIKEWSKMKEEEEEEEEEERRKQDIRTVSYTHLTLPTIYSV